MRDDQHSDEFPVPERRKRTLWIVALHVLIVAAFFTATFFWGTFK